MSETGFTPGPWRADRNLGCKRITTKRYEQHRQARRTEITCTSGLYPEKEDAANARLIAAAPDLYEALNAIMFERWSSVGRSEQVSDMARAALAKARGEA